MYKVKEEGHVDRVKGGGSCMHCKGGGSCIVQSKGSDLQTQFFTLFLDFWTSDCLVSSRITRGV